MIRGDRLMGQTVNIPWNFIDKRVKRGRIGINNRMDLFIN